MQFEVFLTGYNVDEKDVSDRTVIVVDVLRTSTTIASALHNGAAAVVPVADMGEASTLASNLDPLSFLLGGERSGVRIEGYQFGNSPLEYTTARVKRKILILNTTNGTPSIRRAIGAAHLVVGSFVNAERVVDFVSSAGLDTVIVCAGWRNRVSLEDTLCAGMLLHRLWDGVEPPDSTDTSHIAFTLYQREQKNILAAVRRSRHGKRLAQMGRSEDVDFCGSIDILPVLPYFQDSRLVPHAAGG
ncbi:MAG: 2-phosphosulfolactate phosphatase [Rhodothermales bacterium]|nr:2-phosphosulfolactate phosphatase [Rhodothermales bacterium]